MSGNGTIISQALGMGFFGCLSKVFHKDDENALFAGGILRKRRFYDSRLQRAPTHYHESQAAYAHQFQVRQRYEKAGQGKQGGQYSGLQ